MIIRLKILIPIFLLFSLVQSLSAQKQEIADRYFQEGAGLLQQGYYADSIPLFEKATKIL